MTTRPLDMEDYPAHGHMVVLSPSYDAVYWLRDRHARVHLTDTSYTVALEGPGQHLLKAAAVDGIVTFDEVTEYVRPDDHDEAAAQAFATLHDPATIRKVLLPPYIADLAKRPLERHLAKPDAPWWRNRLALLPHVQHVAWCWPHLDPDGRPALYGAPVLSTGAIDWGASAPARTHAEETVRDGKLALPWELSAHVWDTDLEHQSSDHADGDW
ncbi:hypothetical protein AB0F17_34655 [Nonomuraea sp. NPDC026600]|uniref:hypothetical protein n=1 Tax=Nonomuraea sp. NPDC026600 TaxID=3155363 RepID=UPI0034089A95